MAFKWLTDRIWGTLKTADEEGNVLIGDDKTIPAAGNAHYTISQRLAEMRTRGSKIGCYGCAVLTWIQNRFGYKGDHCTNAMKDMPWNIPSSSA